MMKTTKALELVASEAFSIIPEQGLSIAYDLNRQMDLVSCSESF
jgi:hypothetical protein